VPTPKTTIDLLATASAVAALRDFARFARRPIGFVVA
jgi:hypothetical protein